MSNWQKTLVPTGSPILKAVELIDAGGICIAFVIDESRRLLGTVTDGDIRRAILKGINLKEPVDLIMNRTPTVGTLDMSKAALLHLMKSKDLRQVPILNHQGHIVEVEVVDNLGTVSERDNLVVLMVGGMGKRLHPLTKDCPKPMLKVGDKPILESIIERFLDQGFSRFCLSVNYMAEVFESYFGDGSKWGAKISYLRETEPLGTAGALSLLREKLFDPIMVMNGDLLTKLNFEQLLDFHLRQGSQATMCVREYDLQVPYGVVSLNNDYIQKIEEKPVYTYFVNSGIYVLEPEMIEFIPKNTFFDMPDLFDYMIRRKLKVAAFPVREYWTDIGQSEELSKAKTDFKRHFE